MKAKACTTALFALALCLLGIGQAFAQLPQNYQEFKARYQRMAQSPEGAVKMHFMAIFCYLNPSTRSEASKMLRYSMHMPQPLEKNRNTATFVERMKNPRTNFVFRSYCKGATPRNNYRMSPDNFKLVFTGRDRMDDYLKLFLRSSGADSPRPVWVQRHDGLWYTVNNSSLYVMVREPQSFREERRHQHDADYD